MVMKLSDFIRKYNTPKSNEKCELDIHDISMDLIKFLAFSTLTKKQIKTNFSLINKIIKDECVRNYVYQATGVGKTEEILYSILAEIIHNKNRKNTPVLGISSHRIILILETVIKRIIPRIIKKNDDPQNIQFIDICKEFLKMSIHNFDDLDGETLSELKKYKKVLNNLWYGDKDHCGLGFDQNKIELIICNSGSINENSLDRIPYSYYKNYKDFTNKNDKKQSIYEHVEENKRNGIITIFIFCYQSTLTFMNYVNENKLFDTFYCDEFHTLVDQSYEIVDNFDNFLNLSKRVFSFSGTPITDIISNKEIADVENNIDKYNSDDFDEYHQERLKRQKKNLIKLKALCKKNLFGEEIIEGRVTPKDACMNGLIVPIEFYLMNTKDPKGNFIEYGNYPSIEISNDRSNFHIEALFESYDILDKDLEEHYKNNNLNKIYPNLFCLLPLNCKFITKMKETISKDCKKRRCNFFAIDSKNKGIIYSYKKDQWKIDISDQEFLSLLNNVECCDKEWSLKDYENNIIVNIDKLNVGIDLPNVNCIYIGRVLGDSFNCAKLIQTCGRGVRLVPTDRKKNFIESEEDGTTKYNAFDYPELYDKPWCKVFFPVNVIKDIEKLENKNAHQYIKDVIFKLYDIMTFSSIFYFDNIEGKKRIINFKTPDFKNNNDDQNKHIIESKLYKILSSVHESFDDVNNKFITLYNYINDGNCSFSINYYQNKFDEICEKYESLDETSPGIISDIKELISQLEHITGLNAESLIHNN